jgi:hypothetical protein
MKIYTVSKITDHVNTEPILLTHQELVELIQNLPYSPFTFFDEYRSIANSRGTEILVLDFDSGTLTLCEALKNFKQYKHIIATTRSHQIFKNGKIVDRFRVILFFDSFISCARKYKYNYNHFVSSQLLVVDTSCQDFSRYYFASTEVVSSNENGQLVETFEVPVDQTIKKKMDTKRTVANGQLVFSPIHTEKGVLSHRTRNFLSKKPISATSNWHAEFVWAASDLKGQLYSIEEAKALLKAITGHLDVIHDIPQLTWVFEVSSFTVPYRYPRPNFTTDGGR